jgi:hypothetical protein
MMLFEIYDNILCLLAKLFLSTVVLLQRMILNFYCVEAVLYVQSVKLTIGC